MLDVNNKSLDEIYLKGKEYFDNIDYLEAFKYFEYAVKEGHTKSECYIGICYSCGFGVDIDHFKAVYYYSLAASKKDPEALNNLANKYKKGEGVEKDIIKAIELYKEASLYNWPNAHNNLGNIYFFELKDYKESIIWYKKASKHNVSNAEFMLGVCYQYGYGVKKDDKKAFHYFELASNHNHIGAKNSLGNCYYYGSGVDINYEKAISLYEEAANKNYYAAISNLGNCYYYGTGVDQDYEEAYKLYMKSIELKPNLSKSYYNVGYLYYYGNYVNKDITKAKEYFELAKNNNVNSLYAIEMCDRLLGEEDYNNLARKFIENLNEDNFIEQINTFVNNNFTSKYVTDDFKTCIFMCLFNYYNCYKIKDNKQVTIDYSCLLSELFKALEITIRKYLIKDFYEYITSNLKPESITNKYYLQNVNGEYSFVSKKKIDKFTLGSLKEALGIKEIPLRTIDNHDVAYQYDDNSDILDAIDLTMFKFIKEKVFNKNKFGGNVNAEMVDFIIDLYSVISSLVDELRNNSIHSDIISLEQAEQAINYLLFTKKLLVKFYQNMK